MSATRSSAPNRFAGCTTLATTSFQTGTSGCGQQGRLCLTRGRLGLGQSHELTMFSITGTASPVTRRKLCTKTSPWAEVAERYVLLYGWTGQRPLRGA